MSALVVIAAVFAYLGVYFYIGWRITLWDMPALWGRAHERWSSESYIRTMVTTGAAWTLFFWPFRFPFLLTFRAIDRLDPARVEAELKEGQKRIRDLERELGVR